MSTVKQKIVQLIFSNCFDVNVDQVVRPLPPKTLNILVGLALKLDSLYIIVSVVENIWTFWFVSRIFCVASLERFVLAGIS